VLASQGWEAAEVWPQAWPASFGVVLDGFTAAIPPGQDVILIAHSNAGLYVPQLTVQRRVAAYVFVDAVLPPPAGRAEMIPADLYQVIAAKADADGILPPWSRWWDEDMSWLFPSVDVQAEFERGEPRLPLSYFNGTVAIPDGWDDRPGAYLAFGHTYAEELADARGRGWPTGELDGGHLHMLVDPADVADEIATLIAAIR